MLFSKSRLASTKRCGRWEARPTTPHTHSQARCTLYDAPKHAAHAGVYGPPIKNLASSPQNTGSWRTDVAFFSCGCDVTQSLARKKCSAPNQVGSVNQSVKV